MAPLLDAGADAEAKIHRLWETPDGHVVPILVATLRQGSAAPRALQLGPRPSEPTVADSNISRPTGNENSTAVWFLAIGALLMALLLAGYYFER